MTKVTNAAAMLLLTMTPAMVAAVQRCRELAPESLIKLESPPAPSLAEPQPGNPISRGQLLEVSKLLKEHAGTSGAVEDGAAGLQYSLSELLRGSTVYVPPPPPKKEPTPEFKALMERLRKEQEAREYERMINPPPQLETFAQRFPGSPSAQIFPSAVDMRSKEEQDEITFADVNRQLTLIINVMISVVACSVAIWLWARSWSTPQRLGLSMTGSAVVALAEVVIYLGYLRRLKEAKTREKKKVEVKRIVDTWVIEKGTNSKGGAIGTASANEHSNETLRLRKGKYR